MSIKLEFEFKNCTKNMAEGNNKEARLNVPLGNALLKRAQERGAKAHEKQIRKEEKKKFAKALALLITR